MSFEAAAWPAPSRSVLLFVAMKVMNHKEIAPYSIEQEFTPKAVKGPAQLGVVPCYSAAENNSFLETAFPFEVDTGTRGQHHGCWGKWRRPKLKCIPHGMS